jgi:serine/threonine-protein kinase
VGSLIDGRYRVLRVLGSGGMGILLLGRNEALDVDVAIKVLRPDTPEECDVVASYRLVQEARAAAQLGHPAIVRVFDFGVTEQGSPYLVMERLDGTDLGSELEARGSVPPVKAVRCLLPLAHGLAAVHDRGIVHRDVKPENIFLAHTDAGRVQPKVIDFGVAKMDRRCPAERITAVGGMVGSPGNMAPEQALGEDSGPAADVWSLCVVLYEMVTGRLPFRGDNYNALMRAIIDRDPAPLDTHLPGESALAAIVARGMAKAPADRWPSMRRLGEELAAWLLVRGVTEDVAGQAVETTWLSQVGVSRRFDPFASVPPPSPLRLWASPAGVMPPPVSRELSGALPVPPAAASHRPAMPPPPPLETDVNGVASVPHTSHIPRSPPTPITALPAPAAAPAEGRRTADRGMADRRLLAPWLILALLLAVLAGAVAAWALG